MSSSGCPSAHLRAVASEQFMVFSEAATLRRLIIIGKLAKLRAPRCGLWLPTSTSIPDWHLTSFKGSVWCRPYDLLAVRSTLRTSFGSLLRMVYTSGMALPLWLLWISWISYRWIQLGSRMYSIYRAPTYNFGSGENGLPVPHNSAQALLR